MLVGSILRVGVIILVAGLIGYAVGTWAATAPWFSGILVGIAIAAIAFVVDRLMGQSEEGQ